jgi:dTDP-4-dehydrorhamnose reductase
MPSALLDRVLIIGASGQLGSALARVFADCKPVMPSRAALDIEDADALADALQTFRPTLVLNAAAFHNVPLCEERTDRAFAVNALTVDRLAGLCARVGAFLTHVSTDYVFDGAKRAPYSEMDAPVPLNVYGASKLAGEHLIARHGERFLIVRTSALYAFGCPSSLKGVPFIEKIFRQVDRGERLRVVDDIIFSPSYAPHVAWAMRRLLEAGGSGVVHVSNAGETTWHGFASAALEEAGMVANIEPIAALDVPVRRPRYSAFALGRAMSLGVGEMPDWRVGLRAYLEHRALGLATMNA